MGKKYLLISLCFAFFSCVVAQKTNLFLIAESENLLAFPNHIHNKKLAFTPHWLLNRGKDKTPLLAFRDRNCSQVCTNAESILMSLADTISTFDPETFEPITSVVPYCIDYYSFSNYKIYQRIYLDTIAGQLFIIPISFAPVYDIYDRNDNFISHQPLFWFPINNHRPKLMDKITWSAVVKLELRTADFHFIENRAIDLIHLVSVEYETKWVWNNRQKRLHVQARRIFNY